MDLRALKLELKNRNIDSLVKEFERIQREFPNGEGAIDFIARTNEFKAKEQPYKISTKK